MPFLNDLSFSIINSKGIALLAGQGITHKNLKTFNQNLKIKNVCIEMLSNKSSKIQNCLPRKICNKIKQ